MVHLSPEKSLIHCNMKLFLYYKKKIINSLPHKIICVSQKKIIYPMHCEFNFVSQKKALIQWMLELILYNKTKHEFVYSCHYFCKAKKNSVSLEIQIKFVSQKNMSSLDYIDCFGIKNSGINSLVMKIIFASQKYSLISLDHLTATVERYGSYAV